MIGVKVNVADGASPLMRQLIKSLSGESARELNMVGAFGARTAAIKYHDEYDKKGGWENPALPTHGAGRKSTGFGGHITKGWNVRPEADAKGATIINSGPHLRHKVHGGTIKAKRVKFLTIPLIPQAHGIRAREYERDFGVDLFTIKGRNALFQKDDSGTERITQKKTVKGFSGKKSNAKTVTKIRPVYALVRSITQNPWTGALPGNALLADAFLKAWMTALTDELKRVA